MSNNHEPIECPFCGEKTVTAKIGTRYYFVSERPMNKGGIVMDGESIGEIIGDMTCPPIMQLLGFNCSSCGKFWSDHEYAPVKGEDGLFSFEKQEKKSKRKGKKSND